MIKPGIVVVDTSCFRFLESEAVQLKIERDLRTTAWELWPSAVNALEIAQTPNPDIRQRLLNVLRSLAKKRDILPWPHVLLERSAEAIAKGRPGFWSGPSRMSWTLDSSVADISSEEADRAEAFLSKQTTAFEEMHEEARPKVRNFLRSKNLRNEWDTLPEFLDEFWMTPEHIDSYITKLWKHFDLTDPVPTEQLRYLETWRLFFEAQGAAVFERTVMDQMPKPVHLPDLLQLVYLAGARRRLLVTADGGLIRAATAVVRGRYDKAWITHVSSLIE